MAFWITLIRGILALGLGAALLLQPEKSLPMLANFMGIYWLVSGAMSLRWGGAGRRVRPLALVAGIIGVLAGLAMLARWFAMGEGWEAVFASVLGGIIALTGIPHIYESLRTTRDAGASRVRSWTGVLLGAFEVVLGVLLLFSPLERRGPVFFGVVTAWALLGGAILLLDAVRLRRSVSATQQAGLQDGHSSVEDDSLLEIDREENAP